ncbi:MAG: hypothetical protein AAB393_06580, partial [Bacteroidota bacterium]
MLLGFLLGAIIPLAIIVIHIVYISKTNLLQRRIDVVDALLQRLARAEEDIRELQRKLTAPKEPPGLTKVEPVAAMTPSAASKPQPIVAEPRRVEAQPAAAPSVISPPSPSRRRDEWEALIGGKLLNRI